MLAQIEHKGKLYKLDFSMPIDISIPMYANDNCVRAWYVPPINIEPVRNGDWIGEINQGGSVNFRNILFNPHGNGTHTECVGHISTEDYSINNCLKDFMFKAALVSIEPEVQGEDHIITLAQIKTVFPNSEDCEAIVIRSLPNGDNKKHFQHSNTNPPYLHHEAAIYLREIGIKHLLIDQPSVDREFDDGKLLSHRAFWNYPENTRTDATITELIYVPESIADGFYLLNIQFASFENDASPSKPVLYALQ